MRPIAISCGDPSGIGTEIIIKAWLNRQFCNLPCFFIVGSYEIIAQYSKLLNINVPLQKIKANQLQNYNDINEIYQTSLPILDIENKQFFSPSIAKTENVDGIIECIETAVSLIFKGYASAIVTCPIAKSNLYKAGFKFPGHTEFLAHLAYKHTNNLSQAVMMLKGKELAVVPTTIHIALKEVTNILTAKLIIDTVKITYQSLQEKFNIKNPRISIAGLTPHASEDGSMGTEEQTIIIPAINSLKKMGIFTQGPLPADTMFYKNARVKYDAAICMYHDQALIPIKTLHFDDAVNITLGLPFIRTSPDHGTAFNIAGKNVASYKSLAEAILTAQIMVQNSEYR